MKGTKENTMGPAYNKFGYYENSAAASNFSEEKNLTDINVQKVWLTTSQFL